MNRLFEARVELEHLAVENERTVGVADLATGDDRGGVQVLHLLLRVIDELREPQHDVDQLVPVFVLAVELHQLGQELAVLRAFVERGDVALGRQRAIIEFAAAMSPISVRMFNAVFVGRDVEVAGLDLDQSRPALEAFVGLG